MHLQGKREPLARYRQPAHHHIEIGLRWTWVFGLGRIEMNARCAELGLDVGANPCCGNAGLCQFWRQWLDEHLDTRKLAHGVAASRHELLRLKISRCEHD